eukprot:2427480-Pyramimonas_sp.AAC.1
MIRMAHMFALPLRPRIAGRFSPGPSATLADCVSGLAVAGCPAGLPLYVQAILQCPDDLRAAAPAHTPGTHRGLLGLYLVSLYRDHESAKPAQMPEQFSGQ